MYVWKSQLPFAATEQGFLLVCSRFLSNNKPGTRSWRPAECSPCRLQRCACVELCHPGVISATNPTACGLCFLSLPPHPHPPPPTTQKKSPAANCTSKRTTVSPLNTAGVATMSGSQSDAEGERGAVRDQGMCFACLCVSSTSTFGDGSVERMA